MLVHRLRTGEWPAVKIDLSEAYANVRRRSTALRRRRIITGSVAAIMLLGLLSVVGVYYASALPLPAQLALPATTTVYYSDGTTVMARLGSQRRIVVSASTLPSYIGAAVIAAEDPQYWVTSGTLISRQYARAATLAAGESTEGPAAEARLLVMSWKLEDTYSKAEILEFYLNTVYFGRGAYGIEAAARSYFGIPAAELSLPQAILLAGMIESPGDGRFDPSVNPLGANTKFATVAQSMVSMGRLDQATASRLAVPKVDPYDPSRFASGMDRPTGLVVARVLAELRATEPFRDKPPGYLEDGGYRIVTTIDARVQALLERTIGGTDPESLMRNQPTNVTAAAVVVEPGTGRVLAYYGGPSGVGADYAGVYRDTDGTLRGYGAHPPAQTFAVYALAAGLRDGVSVLSRWDSPSVRTVADGQVRDARSAPCSPACTLVDAAVTPLSIPFYSLTSRVGAAAVVDLARAAGIDTMWTRGTDNDLPAPVELSAAGATSSFGIDVALGVYPVTVLDQANAMATFAAGGRRAPAHVTISVTKDYATIYREPPVPPSTPVLDAAELADLTWALSQNPAGQLPDGTASASLSGSGYLGESVIDVGHAWQIGFTPNLAMAVWVGNVEDELPLRNAVGDRIYGETLPAAIYRTVLAGATTELGLPQTSFPSPAHVGDPTVGDAA